MMPQPAIVELVGTAPKITSELTEAQLDRAVALLDALVPPISGADARALVALLPADGDLAFGVNWTILHAIESSPEWPCWDVLAAPGNEWVERLRRRLANAGLHPPSP